MGGFAESLRALIDERAVSANALARQVPCDKSPISRYLSGRQRPSARMARRLDDILGTGGDLAAAAGQPGTVAHRRAALAAASDPAATMDLVRRLRASDVDSATLDALAGTTELLCMQYAYRRPAELRQEACRWLSHVSALLDGRTGLREHRELLVTAGWLTLLIGCLEYDSGMSSAAEANRLSAFHLGREAGHGEIVAWSLEMAAWFAHTRGDLAATVSCARAGQEAAGDAGVAVQLIAHEARALGRKGDKRAVSEALDRGYGLLQSTPRRGNPLNHFVIDPAKFDFYAMDCYRVVGDNARAAEHAAEVVRLAIDPDGRDLAPMRMAEARIALGSLAARSGELEEAAHYGTQAFGADRKCMPSLLLVAGELDAEMRERYPGEQPAREFHEQLIELRRKLPQRR
jgi:transcriptional regulator with XRE-family HTH domain